MTSAKRALNTFLYHFTFQMRRSDCDLHAGRQHLRIWCGPLPRTLQMAPNLYNGFELSARVYVKSLRQSRLLTDRAILPLIGEAATEPSAYIGPGTSARTSRGPGALGGWPLKWGTRRISKNAERLTDHSRICREKICSLGDPPDRAKNSGFRLDFSVVILEFNVQSEE